MDASLTSSSICEMRTLAIPCEDRVLYSPTVSSLALFEVPVSSLSQTGYAQ
jgi:hypothetical protein